MLSSAVTEPGWVRLEKLQGARIPPDVAGWLRDKGSLTKALVQACPGEFRVQVQRQGWDAALPSERRLLGLSNRHTALLREVELHCDNKPWVFARTLIPVSSLQGSARRLKLLRDKPLGAVLFADPRTRRLAIEVAKFKPHHLLFRRACSHLAEQPAEIWGRRTLFSFAGQQLLVNEIFLPAVTAGQ